VRILHLTSNDGITAGAGSIARLHAGLRAAGHASLVLVSSGAPARDGYLSLSRPLPLRAADRAVRWATEGLGVSGGVRPGFTPAYALLQRLAPDIVHLHWTYGARNIPLSAVGRLARQYPLVWTFHDMWAITGGCTNARGCERWRSGCGGCPLVGVDAMVTARVPHRDMTAAAWALRERAFRERPFSVVAPSGWMAGIAASSPLLTSALIEQVPNGLDLEQFKPGNAADARARLGMNPQTRTLLFVGKPGNIDAYAGRLTTFMDVLALLPEGLRQGREGVQVLLVGEGGEPVAAGLGLPVRCVGAVTSAADMAACFQAADVFVHTTFYDNYPGVVQEALACGIPVVASRVGGVPELVRDGETGVLCPPGEARAFAAALAALLSDDRRRATMALAARRFAVETFETRAVTQTMLGVYETRMTEWRRQQLAGVRRARRRGHPVQRVPADAPWGSSARGASD
jgi:glycosyltransferase involved in cell wall biosynthesis